MNKINHVKVLIAAGILTVSAIALPGIAEAKTRIGIYFGVPFYDGALRDDYLYDLNYGWYAPEYRYQYRRNTDNFGNRRANCDQAVRDLRRSGYRNVRVRDCSGRFYQFQARKNGRTVTLSYNSRTRAFNRV
jgi:hypothetical protein